MEVKRPQDKASVAMARSAIMRAVKSHGTAPERAVRRIAHSLAPGYRLNRGGLPGKPDIVYGPRLLAIFVHGCFWHGHNCPRGAREPRDNSVYWRQKLAGNRARDANNLAALAALGWRTLVIYECALKDRAGVERLLGAVLAWRVSRGKTRLHR